MNTVTAPRIRQHSVTLSLTYGDEDIERAAESLNVMLSEEEVDAILGDVDSELHDLAASAARSAVASRIYEDLVRVARGHAWSDDD